MAHQLTHTHTHSDILEVMLSIVVSISQSVVHFATPLATTLNIVQSSWLFLLERSHEAPSELMHTDHMPPVPSLDEPVKQAVPVSCLCVFPLQTQTGTTYWVYNTKFELHRTPPKPNCLGVQEVPQSVTRFSGRLKCIVNDNTLLSQIHLRAGQQIHLRIFDIREHEFY
eukprot:2854913-Amphidinium_carterae.2